MTEPGHPTPEALADALAGAPEAEAATLAHLESCPSCQDDAAALARVSADLGALGPLELPADVADRLDAALADARETAPVGSVVPLTARRDRSPRWLAAAAAAAVVLTGAGTALLVTRDDGSRSDPPSALTAAGEPRVDRSGFDYTPANLGGAVTGLVTGDRALAGAEDRAGAGAASTSTAPAEVAPKTLNQDSGAALEALADPAALAACLVRALGTDSGEPRAVDLASFQGTPAVIVALEAPDKPGRLDVYVLDPGCPEGTFRYFARIAAPAEP